MIKDLKSQAGFVTRDINGTNKNTSVVNNETMDISDGEESDRSQSAESNRSDDNVLISNKYARADVQNNTTDNITEEEWVNITELILITFNFFYSFILRISKYNA